MVYITLQSGLIFQRPFLKIDRTKVRFSQMPQLLERLMLLLEVKKDYELALEFSIALRFKKVFTSTWVLWLGKPYYAYSINYFLYSKVGFDKIIIKSQYNNCGLIQLCWFPTSLFAKFIRLKFTWIYWNNLALATK